MLQAHAKLINYDDIAPGQSFWLEKKTEHGSTLDLYSVVEKNSIGLLRVIPELMCNRYSFTMGRPDPETARIWDICPTKDEMKAVKWDD